MKPQFVETIKILDGKAQNITYHQDRLERTIRHFFPTLCDGSVLSLEQLVTPCKNNGVYKCRVVYGEHGIEAIEYAPYNMREIDSLQVVDDETIEYGFKSTDRSRLNALSAKKGDCDDIIIVKQGLVRDTSFTNIAIFDGNLWTTPRHPLLPGTKRVCLLDNGIIEEDDITLQKLRDAQKARLFNAMIEFGEIEISTSNIHF